MVSFCEMADECSFEQEEVTRIIQHTEIKKEDFMSVRYRKITFLFPPATQAAVQADDRLHLLEFVIDAIELGGKQALLGR